MRKKNFLIRRPVQEGQHSYNWSSKMTKPRGGNYQENNSRKIPLIEGPKQTEPINANCNG